MFQDNFEREEFIARKALLELKELYPNYFKYDIKFTEDKFSEYDAYYFVEKDGIITKRVLIELKIRKTIFPDYILESKKLNSLLDIREELYLNEEELGLLYINFCPNETIIWNIDSVKETKKSKIHANKATSLSRTDKKDKSVLMLKPEEGIQLKYIINEEEILNKVTINKIIDKKITEIKNGLFQTLFKK